MIIAVCRLLVATLDSSSHDQHYAKPHGGSSPRVQGCLEPSRLEPRSGLGSSRLVNNTSHLRLINQIYPCMFRLVSSYSCTQMLKSVEVKGGVW